MLSLVLHLGLFALGAGPLEASGHPCEMHDEQRQSFRTCFDLLDSWAVGSAASTSGWTLENAVLLRKQRPSESKGALWFREQRLLLARGSPVEEHRFMDAQAYQGLFLRHLEEGFLLLPTAQPKRIPFPFDVGFSLTLAHYERRVFEGPGWSLETGRAALLLDPIRSSTGRYRLAVGPSLSHSLQSDGQHFTQEFSPFTALAVDGLAQSEDGWWVARLNGTAGWTFLPGGNGVFRAQANGSVERVVFAINDRPLTLFARGTAAVNDAGVQRKTELSAAVGMAFRPL